MPCFAHPTVSMRLVHFASYSDYPCHQYHRIQSEISNWARARNLVQTASHALRIRTGSVRLNRFASCSNMPLHRYRCRSSMSPEFILQSENVYELETSLKALRIASRTPTGSTPLICFASYSNILGHRYRNRSHIIPPTFLTSLTSSSKRDPLLHVSLQVLCN